jgi:hypothetical protein
MRPRPPRAGECGKAAEAAAGDIKASRAVVAQGAYHAAGALKM